MADQIDTAATVPAAPPLKRPLGRPRRLTLDAIVDAACELGVDQIEMAHVAKRLNTGVGTLYSYVRSREQLLNLVAARLAERYCVEDRGQDWRDLLREHGEMASGVFKAMPHLIGDLLTARHLTREDDYAERFIGMLTKRGFTMDDAVDVYVEATQIIIGAAICAQRRRVRAGIEPNGEDIIPLPAIVGDHRPTLERLIRDVDATRVVRTPS